MKVAIEGKLNQSRWQAEDGTNRSKIEIIVDEIEFMSRQGQTASKPVQQQQQQFAPQPMQQQAQPQQFVPQAAPQPMQAAPVQQAMPMMQQQAPQQVASIYDEDIPF